MAQHQILNSRFFRGPRFCRLLDQFEYRSQTLARGLGWPAAALLQEERQTFIVHYSASFSTIGQRVTITVRLDCSPANHIKPQLVWSTKVSQDKGAVLVGHARCVDFALLCIRANRRQAGQTRE